MNQKQLTEFHDKTHIALEVLQNIASVNVSEATLKAMVGIRAGILYLASIIPSDDDVKESVDYIVSTSTAEAMNARQMVKNEHP